MRHVGVYKDFISVIIDHHHLLVITTGDDGIKVKSYSEHVSVGQLPQVESIKFQHRDLVTISIQFNDKYCNIESPFFTLPTTNGYITFVKDQIFTFPAEANEFYVINSPIGLKYLVYGQTSVLNKLNIKSCLALRHDEGCYSLIVSGDKDFDNVIVGSRMVSVYRRPCSSDQKFLVCYSRSLGRTIYKFKNIDGDIIWCIAGASGVMYPLDDDVYFDIDYGKKCLFIMPRPTIEMLFINARASMYLVIYRSLDSNDVILKYPGSNLRPRSAGSGRYIMSSYATTDELKIFGGEVGTFKSRAVIPTHRNKIVIIKFSMGVLKITGVEEPDKHKYRLLSFTRIDYDM